MSLDFSVNKRVCKDVAQIPTKRMRNKIAGFATHLMKRMKKGPVRGISLKIQEEEREKRMDYVPRESEIKNYFDWDKTTEEMLNELNMDKLLNFARKAHK
mmetsp:Transcript_2490/g.4980  ORF Transcript_2490/g.4980 Transcript_2490/m.4980 type:complete len:100 (+) Transcript_2490:81-380(+)|eukprot:CAMPEP_0116920306 /NCGR_PEP_ID=MMETSP0467-20121206/20932_1 /TAXON_ID=283647 /ORGANISM="Mesodinium pulex, Strain SPMC105" /LENGTH=99 /DNA_ID=CAMNT_0004598109 /DNA_START=80 /DNA_END=379 /DNA_ORIENTATION=+